MRRPLTSTGDLYRQKPKQYTTDPRLSISRFFVEIEVKDWVGPFRVSQSSDGSKFPSPVSGTESRLPRNVGKLSSRTPFPLRFYGRRGSLHPFCKNKGVIVNNLGVILICVSLQNWVSRKRVPLIHLRRHTQFPLSWSQTTLITKSVTSHVVLVPLPNNFGSYDPGWASYRLTQTKPTTDLTHIDLVTYTTTKLGLIQYLSPKFK